MKMKFLFSLILILVIATSSFAQQAIFDSLQNIIKLNKQDTNQVKAMYTYAALIRNSDINKCISISDESLKLSKKLNFKKGEGTSLLNIATVNHVQGNYDTAIIVYNQALEIFTKLKIKKSISKCYNNLGNLYQLKADYSKAIEYLLLCKKIGEELKDNKVLTDCETNIGNVYLQKKEYPNALKHYEQGIFLAKQNKDLVALSQLYNNKGAALRWQKNLTEALVNYKTSLSIREQLSDVGGIAENSMNIGDVYFHLPSYDSANYYFSKASKIYESVGHKTGVAYCLNNIGAVLFKTNKNNAAADTMLKVINISNELGLRDLKVEAYKILAEGYYQMGKYKESSEYMGVLMALKDSLLNEQNNKQIAEMETKYESVKKDKEIIKQTAEIKNQQIEAEKKATERNALIIGIFLLLALAIFIFRGYKQKQKANKLIIKQKEEVEKQKLIVEHQKELVEEHQKEILDSINYAKRIQYTLLAHADFLKVNLPEHFVFFNPKDIVSGDFYWATLKDNKFYLAACDSTGHGVPGAFMSLLNIGFLSEAINEKGIVATNEVFNFVRQRLTDTISKEGQQDGFDGILVCFDKTNNTITYSAANNAPVLVSNGELIDLPADKMPVGIGERKQDFTVHTLNYKTGDSLYLYTDGYADQFGGPKGKKFKYKPLNEMLIANSNKTVQEQSDVLKQAFASWKGNLEQVDDVLIIGIKL